MAVTAGTLRRRQNQEAKAAAKAKREKVILAVGVLVLVGVLALELPKIMSSGGSSSSTTSSTPAAGSTAPAAVAPAAGPAAITPDAVRHDLKVIAHLPSKDPFKSQAGGTPAASQGVQPMGTAPRVRLSHFVSKDPFHAQLGGVTGTTPAAPIATPPTKAQATTSSAAPFGYIVILRSLNTRASGLSEVRKAHSRGLKGAALLYSSKYTTLRHGYWVVYLSRYSTVADANAGLQYAHAHGYVSAYRRPVRK